MSKTLVVIGTGLIGSSLAKAAKAACARSGFETVWAINRSEQTNVDAIKLGVADKTATYAELESVMGSLVAGDLVVVAVPVYVYPSIFESLKPLLPEGVWLTDVGSSKAAIVEAAKQVWGQPPAFFVPGHPIAGSEKTGVSAVNSELFEKRRCILTPHLNTDTAAIEVVKSLWESVGAEVDIMGSHQHDDILAATSHLPHVLAYAIVDALYTLEQKTEIFRYAAGGFRDFTRIAASDPVMWRDIFLSNRGAILQQLDNFESHLADLRAAIEASDSTALDSILERSQGARKLFSEINNKPS